jgi:hypothetical protein
MNEAYFPSLRTITYMPSRVYPDTARVLIYSETVTPSREIKRVYTLAEPPSRLYAIPCRLAPMFLIRPQLVESQTDSGVAERTNFTCMLRGLYPEIKLEDRVRINAADYDVVSNEEDGSNIYTRLGLVLRGT